MIIRNLKILVPAAILVGIGIGWADGSLCVSPPMYKLIVGLVAFDVHP